MQITIVSKRKPLLKLPSILIDRTTFLGNPFVMGKDGNRKEVIQRYKEYFDYKMCNDPVFRSQFFSLCKFYAHYDRIQLVCWCAPLACHGDVIKEVMLELFRDKSKEEETGEGVGEG